MEKTLAFQLREEVRHAEATLPQLIQQELSAMEKRYAEHVDRVQDGEQEIQALNDAIAQLQKKIAESVQEGLVEAKRLEAMQKELQQLEHRKQTLPAEIARAIEDETVKRESIKAMESELQAWRQTRSYQISELSKGVSTYKQRLGLDFITVEGMLRVSFTLIDPRNPAATFSFLLQVDENDQYILQDCRPAVRGADALVHELNASNNFSGFVQKMRRLFKAHAQAQL